MGTDKYKWSFSRLNVVRQCLHQFDLTYNQKLAQKDNVWATIGSLIHDICETYLNSKQTKTDAFEALRKWDRDYPWDMVFFDGDLRHKFYYWNIRKFITDVLPTMQGEVVAVEEYFEVDIDDNNVIVGYIDLIVRGEDGAIKVIDWKISKRKSFIKDLQSKQRQLYIYVKHIQEKYGQIPQLMYFYLVAENDYILVRYNDNDNKETWDWVNETIAIAEAAKKNNEYPANPDYFFCKNLCGQSINCDKWKT